MLASNVPSGPSPGNIALAKKSVSKSLRNSAAVTAEPVIPPIQGETAQAEKVQSPSGSSGRWTFLTNHAHVLILLHAHGDLVLRDVANQVGITERAVQKIIQDLVEGGFIEIQRVGRRNHYQVFIDKPLRHPIEAHRQIGDLLKMIAPAKASSASSPVVR